MIEEGSPMNFDILPPYAETNSSVVNGLFNEAMSSCLARVQQAKLEEGEEKQQTFVEETILFAIVLDKRNKL